MNSQHFTRYVLFLAAAITVVTANAQFDTLAGSPEMPQGKKMSVMGLPAISYDADMGFQYGVIGSLSLFGDGSSYPRHHHKFLVEVSRFTKGSGVNQFFYDSPELLPGDIRLTVDVSYLTEQMLDFYGFNGYEVVYEEDLADEMSEEYISRAYYRHERKLFRVITDFQGNIYAHTLKWYGGLSFFDIRVGTVDRERLNRGKKDEKKLPEATLLYDNYKDWGLLPEKEADGGNVNLVKAGLIFDTRDNEEDPASGLWEEAILAMAPSFLFNDENSFAKLSVTHRHYVPIVRGKLTFAYRLAYQGTVWGKAPFYFQPYMINSYSVATRSDGLGGARTLRGILRNRVVGDAVAYSNLELRWKFLSTRLWIFDLDISALGFADGGMVVTPVEVDRSLVPDHEDIDLYFDQDHDSMHWSYGLGARIGVDGNFMISIDYGFATDPRDGRSGLYLGVSHLF